MCRAFTTASCPGSAMGTARLHHSATPLKG